MIRLAFAFVAAILMWGCSGSPDSPIDLPTGIWRATLAIQGQKLPFNIRVESGGADQYTCYIINGEEQLLLDEVFINGDSVIIPLHIFDASFRARFENDSLKGLFVKHYDDKAHSIPFVAVPGQSWRFTKTKEDSAADFSGKYAVRFYGKKDTTQAIGIFRQMGDSVTGSFLTPSGDYRFLQGSVVNDSLKLSAFDGNHTYLFFATKRDDRTIDGTFFSGRTRKDPWTGVLDPNASLPDPESLTYLKEGYEKIEFSFPDPDGKKISLSDPQFKGKVVIIQLLGSWCPNCMDEAKFLNPWYQENQERGVEIIGLAFERKDDFAYASERVKRMQSKMNIKYPLLIAGTDKKESTSAALPMLNAVRAFPTTIFIGKDGKVKKIHTGFSGPGTGSYYDEFKEEFNETINKLLVEDIAQTTRIEDQKTNF